MTARRKMSDSTFATSPAAGARSGAGTVANPDRRSKYTVLLKEADVAIWDDLATQARKRSGRRVTKSELLRLVLAMIADDASLTESLLEQVPADPSEE